MPTVMVILAVVLIAGGVAVIANLGGITSGYVDAVHRGKTGLLHVAERMPPWSWWTARRRRDDARYLRRQLLVARSSGLFFIAVGVMTIVAASRT